MSNRLIHEKIRISMELADLSNSQLARLINVDPSLISRYRSGHRQPNPGSAISRLLSRALWNYIEKNDELKTLSSYMGVCESELSQESYTQWLLCEDISEQKNADEAKKLLDAFDEYSQAAPLSSTSLNMESLIPLIEDDLPYYKGEKGLQDAVVRFLGGIALETLSARELLLFSDQNMKWMVGDPAFTKVWAALMAVCMKKGVRIRIIHNINRGFSEMNQAILSWLPLYLSGMVESYYLNVPEETPFSHTVFLNPDQCAIYSWFTSGAEKEAIYHFYTDPDHLISIKDSFDKLLSQSRPLVYFSDSCDPDTAQMNFSYHDLDISIYEDSVIIKSERIPQKLFTFRHPLMIKAFRSFARTICQ